MRGLARAYVPLCREGAWRGQKRGQRPARVQMRLSGWTHPIISGVENRRVLR